MKLYFQNSRGEERVIAEVVDKSQASRVIYQFLDEHNFKSYYTRMWHDDDGSLWYDVGSHSEFFVLRKD